MARRGISDPAEIAHYICYAHRRASPRPRPSAAPPMMQKIAAPVLESTAARPRNQQSAMTPTVGGPERCRPAHRADRGKLVKRRALAHSLRHHSSMIYSSQCYAHHVANREIRARLILSMRVSRKARLMTTLALPILHRCGQSTELQMSIAILSGCLSENRGQCGFLSCAASLVNRSEFRQSSPVRSTGQPAPSSRLATLLSHLPDRSMCT
jgi:hypothetical protein